MLQALRFRWHRLRRHARMLAADAHGYLRWLALNARVAARGGLGRRAYITPAGWRHIVLVGVDDSRYFWAPPDSTGRWARLLAAGGVTLSVYNPRSLLRDVTSVYERPRAGAGDGK